MAEFDPDAQASRHKARLFGAKSSRLPIVDANLPDDQQEAAAREAIVKKPLAPKDDGRPWSSDEDELILELWKKRVPERTIAWRLKRPAGAVLGRRQFLLRQDGSS